MNETSQIEYCPEHRQEFRVQTGLTVIDCPGCRADAARHRAAAHSRRYLSTERRDVAREIAAIEATNRRYAWVLLAVSVVMGAFLLAFALGLVSARRHLDAAVSRIERVR